jgi:stage II sporulation protein D
MTPVTRIPSRFGAALRLACAFLLCVQTSGVEIRAQDEPVRKRRVTPPAAPPHEAPPLKLEPAPPPRDAGDGPEIRIGLATNADFATISCDGPMAQFDPETRRTDEVASNRITVQLNAGASRRTRGGEYRVQVASLKSGRDADDLARRLRGRFEEPVVTRYDNERGAYVVSVGEFSSPSDAQTMMVRVSNAGYGKLSVARDDAEMRRTGEAFWRLSAVTADKREVAAAAKRLAFVALDPDRAPLKYLNGTYRGRLEVFLNARRRMTVVNVVPMEQYVRGVVPNELSPNAFPQLEALKAQAVAARTYALKNRGAYAGDGFDLLPTALSQVYGGRGSEHPLTNRAVEETRGVIATYQGEPINALYTSTSGGRTESVEFVFGKPAPYLKSVVVAPKATARADRWATTSRRIEPVTDADGRSLARETALLAVVGFPLSERLSPAYLAEPITPRECEEWCDKISFLARAKPASSVPRPATEIGAFARAVLSSLYGNESPATLLTDEDARYLLGTDAASVNESYRKDVAFLIREGVLRPPAGGLRALRKVTRGVALGVAARALLARGIPKLQTGNARPFDGRLVVRGGKGKDDEAYPLTPAPFLFRKLGGESSPVERVEIIGGEAVTFHLDARGRVDYLEVAPVLNGATSDRFSQFSWWEERLTPGEVRARIGRANVFVGDVLDMQPESYGASGRVARLRIVGTNRTATVEGIRIRSVLGVRENLFVIARDLDANGKVASFQIRGRGWGHGVGMCQVGAYGLALEGYAYDQILKHFYTGVELKRMY